MTRPRLVLASSSPRRRELLTGLGLVFGVRSADVDETPRPGEEPETYVARLALEKAARQAFPGELVLGADTIVVLGGELLGKPADAAGAIVMLRRIAGHEHTVFTGVALHEPGSGRNAAVVERSRVRMAAMSDSEIEWYVATGEPLDKAGAYAVQGVGAQYVEEVHGNYTNVVGLPLPATRRLFAELGYRIEDFRGPASDGAGSQPARSSGQAPDSI